MSTVIAPDNVRLSYRGRIERAGSPSPIMAWGGTEMLCNLQLLDPAQPAVVTLRFGPGTTLGVVPEIGQNWFDVRAGTLVHTFDVPQNRQYAEPIEVPAGEQGEVQLSLFKRSEARAGTAAFLGIELENAKLLLPPPEPSLHIEFYGDSITVGACDEDGGADQWEDRSTHDYYYSYAAIVTRALGAVGTAIAVSGMGLVTGWVPFTAEQIRDRAAADPAAPLLAPSRPEPEVVVVALGENDDSFTRANGLAFPAGFSDAYVHYVAGLRLWYPHSLLICFLGGMYGGSCAPELGAAWGEAVRFLAGKDAHLRFLRVQHYSATHPRIPAQYELATDLLLFLREECGLDVSRATE